MESRASPGKAMPGDELGSPIHERRSFVEEDGNKHLPDALTAIFALSARHSLLRSASGQRKPVRD